MRDGRHTDRPVAVCSDSGDPSHARRQTRPESGDATHADPNPTWYGYSVGRWEGDAFVVETAGFKEGSWLTNQGHPHTEALRTTERFRRVEFGRMQLSVTIDDPKVYARPWITDTIPFDLLPDQELLEHLCENNRDLPNLMKIWGTQEGAPGR